LDAIGRKYVERALMVALILGGMALAEYVGFVTFMLSGDLNR
jgi:hypothetical protein